MKEYEIYTDGASRMFNNKTTRMGVMFGVIFQKLSDGTSVIVDEYSGEIPGATSNRSEIFGVLFGIDRVLKSDPGKKRITVYTDSRYVVDNFRVVFKKFITPCKNKVYTSYPNWDLWSCVANRRMLNKDIFVNWVKGHNGNEYNEYCDKMCDAIYRGEVGAIYELK